MADPDLDRAREALERAIDHSGGVHVDACVRCGLCGSSCHIYLADPRPENLPGRQGRDRSPASTARYATRFLGRHFPGSSARAISPREALDESSTPSTVAAPGAGVAASIAPSGLDVACGDRGRAPRRRCRGRVPQGIADTVDNQLGRGIRWPSRRRSSGDLELAFRGPLARDGTPRRPRPRGRERDAILYLINPREVKFFPLSLQAAAGIFHAAGESWTLSSRTYDVTNYGLFAGDDAAAAELTRRVLDEARTPWRAGDHPRRSAATASAPSAGRAPSGSGRGTRSRCGASSSS